MKKVIDVYSFMNTVDVKVYSYDEKVFGDSSDVMEWYSLFFSNYVEYIVNTKNENLIDFLNHSVKSDNHLSDRLEKTNFTIDFEKNLIEKDSIFSIQSCFALSDCLIFTNGSFFFITCKNDKSTYFYYGD